VAYESPYWKLAGKCPVNGAAVGVHACFNTRVTHLHELGIDHKERRLNWDAILTGFSGSWPAAN